MKKSLILLTILLIIPLVHAERFSHYEELDLRFGLGVSIDLVPTGGSPDLERFTANLTLFPRETSTQDVLSLETSSSPTAIITENQDSITFQWNEYNEKLELEIESNVKVQNKPPRVPAIDFPINQDMPNEAEYYLDNTENIDINEDIIQQANSIVEGETDLFTAVYKLAEWTNENIEYDLNSFTETAVQKSSWVLENREGVCDEITSLFISMCRSVGIPAKFVAGTSYTTLEESFGNHGWAEVYFPEYGWAPFDVTFGEYGYINPSHLKLTETLDSSEYSINYKWVQQNIEAQMNPIEIGTEIAERGDKIDSPFDLSVNPLVEQAGPGSYVPFEVSIKNPYDKYSSTAAIVTVAPGLLDDKNYKYVLLKPNEKKKIYFIAQITEDVAPGYTFTTHLEVQDSFGEVASNTFQFSEIFEVFSKQDALDLVESLEQEEEKSYSPQLSLECNSTKSYYYTYEEPEVTCYLKNTGNNYLDDLEICLEEDCQNLDLRISQEEELTFTPEKTTKKLIITAKNQDIGLQKSVNLKIFEQPDLKIQYPEYPSLVNYSDTFNFSFILSSEVLVEDLKIQINNYEPNYIEQSQGSRTIFTNLAAKFFTIKSIKVTIDYEDENGNPFTLEESFEISVQRIPWYIKFVNFFKKIF